MRLPTLTHMRARPPNRCVMCACVCTLVRVCACARQTDPLLFMHQLHRQVEEVVESRARVYPGQDRLMLTFMEFDRICR